MLKNILKMAFHGGSSSAHLGGALSMVDIASMIGTRGLGDEVLLGLQQLNVGAALEAGLAIVLLAIVLDRMTQAYGEKIQERTQPQKKKN